MEPIYLVFILFLMGLSVPVDVTGSVSITGFVGIGIKVLCALGLVYVGLWGALGIQKDRGIGAGLVKLFGTLWWFGVACGGLVVAASTGNPLILWYYSNIMVGFYILFYASISRQNDLRYKAQEIT